MITDINESQNEAKTQELSEIDQLKLIHDHYVCTIQILTTKQFYHEEFKAVFDLVEFYKKMRLEVFNKIQELEPKTEVQNGDN